MSEATLVEGPRAMEGCAGLPVGFWLALEGMKKARAIGEAQTCLRIHLFCADIQTHFGCNPNHYTPKGAEKVHAISTFLGLS